MFGHKTIDKFPRIEAYFDLMVVLLFLCSILVSWVKVQNFQNPELLKFKF